MNDCEMSNVQVAEWEILAHPHVSHATKVLQNLVSMEHVVFCHAPFNGCPEDWFRDMSAGSSRSCLRMLSMPVTALVNVSV